MRYLVVALMQFFVLASYGADERIIAVSLGSFVDTEYSVAVMLVGDRVTVTRGGKVEKKFLLSGDDGKLLGKGLEKALEKNWSGFWTKAMVFDGWFISCYIQEGETRVAFSGINGCPEGFGAFLELLLKQDGAQGIPQVLKGFEKGSKRYESFDQFLKSLVRSE